MLACRQAGYNQSVDDHIVKTIKVYDEIADTYSVDMEEYTPIKERVKFASLIIPGGKILDLGCAAGRDSLYFKSAGFHVIGVDLSEKLLSIARKKDPKIEFIKQDIRKLTFSVRSFDGIWACAVLLHLKRKEAYKALNDIYKLLKPNGILFIMIKIGTGEKDITEKLSSGKSRHFTLFQTSEIRKQLEETGFKIVEFYQWNSRDRWPEKRDVEWLSCFARKT